MIRIVSAIKKYLKLIFNDIKSVLFFNEDDYFKSKSIYKTEKSIVKSIEFVNNYDDVNYNNYKKFD